MDFGCNSTGTNRKDAKGGVWRRKEKRVGGVRGETSIGNKIMISTMINSIEGLKCKPKLIFSEYKAN